jgi:hypothetical protein
MFSTYSCALKTVFMARRAPVANMAATLSDIESGIFTRYCNSGTMMNSAYPCGIKIEFK